MADKVANIKISQIYLSINIGKTEIEGIIKQKLNKTWQMLWEEEQKG